MNEDNALRQNLTLWLLSAAQFMLVLDVAVVNVALPSMQRTLGLSAEGLQWVVGNRQLRALFRKAGRQPEELHRDELG